MTSLILTIKPSKILFNLLLLIHVLCILYVAFLPISILIELPLLLIVILSAYYYCFVVALHSSSKSIEQCVLNERKLDISDRQGRHYVAGLSGESFVSKFLIILVFYPENKYKRKSILIFPDSVERHTFRELKKVLLYV